MQLVVGDMWSELGQADILLATTNAQLDRHGRLIMGAGAAQELRDQFPGIALELGQKLKERHLVLQPYGVLMAPPQFGYHAKPRPTRLGAFQTKLDWKHPSSLDLIRYSVTRLIQLEDRLRQTLVNAGNDRPPRIVINFPGINHGRLQRDDVLPILADLPNGVFIYENDRT